MSGIVPVAALSRKSKPEDLLKLRAENILRCDQRSRDQKRERQERKKERKTGEAEDVVEGREIYEGIN